MDGLASWRFDPASVLDRFVLGLDLFGPYADWLWALPLLWVTAAMSIWFYTVWQQHRRDQAYLAYASRHIPVLRRIARQRAQEVAFSRRTDRF